MFHRHISFSIKADGAHLCCAGSPIVLCFTDTYRSQSRLMAHIYVVLGSLTVLFFTDRYHSQSRLIAPYSIVFHRHISFSFKADGAQLCCAGSPIVFCVT